MLPFCPNGFQPKQFGNYFNKKNLKKSNKLPEPVCSFECLINIVYLKTKIGKNDCNLCSKTLPLKLSTWKICNFKKCKQEYSLCNPFKQRDYFEHNMLKLWIIKNMKNHKNETLWKTVIGTDLMKFIALKKMKFFSISCLNVW